MNDQSDSELAADGSLIGLTRAVESGMPTYPGDPEVRIEPHATHESDGYRVSRVALGSHTGTHVDAPAHTEPDGATLGAFDPEDLRFDARVVDCRDAEAGEAIAPDVLERDGTTAGLDEVSALVFRTGWADAWGTDRMLEHPYLAPETAGRCAEADVAVVTDALSPDPSGGAPDSDSASQADSGHDLPAHRALLGAGLPIVENVCNLGALPETGVFELIVCPLKIDADGAPARVLARV